MEGHLEVLLVFLLSMTMSSNCSDVASKTSWQCAPNVRHWQNVTHGCQVRSVALYHAFLPTRRYTFHEDGEHCKRVAAHGTRTEPVVRTSFTFYLSHVYEIIFHSIIVSIQCSCYTTCITSSRRKQIAAVKRAERKLDENSMKMKTELCKIYCMHEMPNIWPGFSIAL